MEPKSKLAPGPPEPSNAAPRLGTIERSPGELLSTLQARVDAPLNITLTKNRRTYLSFRRERPFGIQLRLHHSFLRAEDHVLAAVAALLKKPGNPTSRKVLRGFWVMQEPQHDAPRRQRRPSESQGDIHDLRTLLEGLLAAHPQEGEPPTIGWGRRYTGKKRRRSIRLGSYDFEGKHITINRALDHATVPVVVVRQVVFHELLHHEFGVVMQGSRRVLHSKAFRLKEASSEDYAPSEAWIKANLNQLLKR